jgi:hypothetical protein
MRNSWSDTLYVFTYPIVEGSPFAAAVRIKMDGSTKCKASSAWKWWLLLLLQTQLMFERRSNQFGNQTRTNERGQIDGIPTYENNS